MIFRPVSPVSPCGPPITNRPGEIHTIEGVEETDVLEVSTPELDDVVRLRDLYGREGTSAP